MDCWRINEKGICSWRTLFFVSESSGVPQNVPATTSPPPEIETETVDDVEENSSEQESFSHDATNAPETDEVKIPQADVETESDVSNDDDVVTEAPEVDDVNAIKPAADDAAENDVWKEAFEELAQLGDLFEDDEVETGESRQRRRSKLIKRKQHLRRKMSA